MEVEDIKWTESKTDAECEGQDWATDLGVKYMKVKRSHGNDEVTQG